MRIERSLTFTPAKLTTQLADGSETQPYPPYFQRFTANRCAHAHLLPDESQRQSQNS